MPSSIEAAGQRLGGAPLAASHNALMSAPVQDESLVGAIDSTMELPLKTLDPLAAAEVAADVPDWLLVAAAPSAPASQGKAGLSTAGSAHARSPTAPTATALAPDFDPTALAPMADDANGVRLSLSEPGAQHHKLHGDVNSTVDNGLEVRIDADEAVATAAFMRRGAGSGLWQRPAVRRGLLTSMLVLALVLLLQAAFIWRDTLAAHVPALRPWFLALCEPVQCQINPLRRIEQLSVESSGLSRIEGAPLHRLSVTLRNRAEIALMTPALDLTVTDTQGKLVARKTLLLTELGVSASSIEAGAELALQALLDTGERRVSGYTVELYYP